MRVENAVKKNLKSSLKKKKGLEKQLDGVDQADHFQKEGDLIIANLYK